MVDFFPPENPDWVSHTILSNNPAIESVTQVQLLRLNTITEMLGHREIDILKMDIEGAEYEVISDLLNTPNLRVRQVLVEFHHWLYPGVSVRDTRFAISKLEQAGYRLFSISKNHTEFSLIKPDDS